MKRLLPLVLLPILFLAGCDKSAPPSNASGDKSGAKKLTIALLPKSKGYFMYTGSLTTPPCTENVTWFVLKMPVQVSADQIARFGRLYPMNARPVQSRNDRDIVGTP